MSATPTNDAPTAPLPPRRRRRWLAPAGLCLLVAATVAYFGWWRPQERSAPAVPPDVPTGIRTDVATAITSARNKVLEEPKSGETWGRLGLVFTAHGYDDQATACYREAHRLDGADDRWAYMLGLYYLSEGRDTAAAINYLEGALACPHRHERYEAGIRLRLAELYLAEMRLADAERLFRQQLGRERSEPRALAGLGATLLSAERPGEAVEFLKGATDSPFTRRKATTGLAAASRRLGDHAAATRYDQQVAQLPEDLPPPDPFVAEAAALRVDWQGGYEEVLALEKEGRIRETIPLLMRMAEDTSNVRAAVSLGQNLSLLGEYATAEPYLRAACAREPENVQAAVLLATVLYDLARSKSADADRKALLRESAAASERAAKLNPRLGMAHFTHGMALRELGDLPAALPHLRLAVDCRPEVQQFQIGLLLALVESGRWDEARARLPVAERVIPKAHPQILAIRKRIEAAPGAVTKP